MISAQDALRRAAERASRRAELEVAYATTQRCLGYALADDQFPWINVMSMPYIHDHFCQITPIPKQFFD